MLKRMLIRAAVVALMIAALCFVWKAVLAIWFLGIVACFPFLPSEKGRRTHTFQVGGKGPAWYLFRAAIWPYWVWGILSFEARRCWRRKKASA